MPWFTALASLPGEATTEDEKPDLTARIVATSHQHPDRDTEAWPPVVA